MTEAKRKYDHKKVMQFVNSNKENMTQRQMAEALNMPFNSLHTIISKNSKRKKAASPRAWSEEDVRIMKEMCKQGARTADVAERLGRTRSAVIAKSHEYSLKWKCTRNQKYNVKTEDVVNDFKNGMTKKEISDKYGLPMCVVVSRLWHAQAVRYHHVKWDEKVNETALRMRREGKSNREIMEATGCSSAALGRHIPEDMKRSYVKWNSETHKKALMLREKGMTNAEIGRALGTSGPKVKYHIGPDPNAQKRKRSEKEAK